MKKKFTALKSFLYNTRRLQAGDVFEAKPGMGRALIAAKRAVAVRDPVKLDAPPTIVTDKIARANRVKREVDPTEQPAAVTQPQPADETTDELAAARADYQAAVGRRAFHGWDAETLREKIAEAAGAEEDDGE